jgi:predicted anti-sigma-YlaC factor YlaD
MGRTVVCDRTREWISLALDGELSELERALMDAHLRRCHGCQRVEAEMQGFASWLRASPLEHLDAPVWLPPRSRGLLRRAQQRAVPVISAGLAASVAVGLALTIPNRADVGRQSERALVAAALAVDSSSEPMGDLRLIPSAQRRHIIAAVVVSGGIGSVKPMLPAGPS